MLIRVNRTLLSPLAQTSYVSAKGSDNSVSLGNLIGLFALTTLHERFVLDAENTQMTAETTNRVYLLIARLKSGISKMLLQYHWMGGRLALQVNGMI